MAAQRPQSQTSEAKGWASFLRSYFLWDGLAAWERAIVAKSK